MSSPAGMQWPFENGDGYSGPLHKKVSVLYSLCLSCAVWGSNSSTEETKAFSDFPQWSLTSRRKGRNPRILIAPAEYPVSFPSHLFLTGCQMTGPPQVPGRGTDEYNSGSAAGAAGHERKTDAAYGPVRLLTADGSDNQPAAIKRVRRNHFHRTESRHGKCSGRWWQIPPHERSVFLPAGSTEILPLPHIEFR